jgi:hypothetical protein
MSTVTIDPILLDKARRSPHAVRFEEALRLCRQLGFLKVRHVRGHRILHHPSRGPLSMQEGPQGRAKAYQVRHLLETARGRRGA